MREIQRCWRKRWQRWDTVGPLPRVIYSRLLSRGQSEGIDIRFIEAAMSDISQRPGRTDFLRGPDHPWRRGRGFNIPFRSIYAYSSQIDILYDSAGACECM
jgi:hypothetical protein